MKTINKLALVFTVALLLLAASVFAVAGSVAPVTQAAPASAINTGSQLFAAVGVTQTVTGTARYLSAYTADCYATTVLTGAQGVVLSLQHSPDASTWVNLSSFGSVTHSGASLATATAFSPSLTFYGTYVRAIATLTGTAPANVSLVCTYH